jgi:hypothetical protein
MKVLFVMCLAVGLSAAQVDPQHPVSEDRPDISGGVLGQQHQQQMLCQSRLKIDEKCLTSKDREAW